jgi:hypothetical protein
MQLGYMCLQLLLYDYYKIFVFLLFVVLLPTAAPLCHMWVAQVPLMRAYVESDDWRVSPAAAAAFAIPSMLNLCLQLHSDTARV